MFFSRLLQARHLRILPLKWHKAIGLRLEVLGCYRPYYSSGATAAPNYPPAAVGESENGEDDESSAEEETGSGDVLLRCEICPGLTLQAVATASSSHRNEKVEFCPCSSGLYWSGTECVPLKSCGCVMGKIRYKYKIIFFVNIMRFSGGSEKNGYQSAYWRFLPTSLKFLVSV